MIRYTPPPPTDAQFAELAQALHDDAMPAEEKAPRPQLMNVSHVHDAIMNWMIANPQRSLRECAQAFGYTQSWLSTMIHSNLFQARLKEKQEAHFSGLSATLNEKLTVGADIGVTKLIEKLETSEDPKFIKETTTMMLDKLGFGAATRVAGAQQVNAGNVQNNFYMASPADLEKARGRISGGVLPSAEIVQVDATPTQEGDA
ncbi:MAG: hypothetical protein ACKOX6_00840 [Bdellovibrio sp.]